MRLIFDEHFPDELAVAVRRDRPGCEAATIHEREWDGTPDDLLLQILDEEKAVLVTRDARTIPGVAAARLAAGLTHGGILLVPRSIRQTDDRELLRRLLGLIDERGGEDWRCRMEWL